jgi:small subunit ribosomal protein S5
MNDSRFYKDRPTDGFEEKIVQVNRVSKKTKGGNKIGFSVLTVVGDKKGKVGVGLGKGPEISSAIKKAVLLGKKHAMNIPIINGTIPFEVKLKLGAAKIMLKPAPRGSGVIAGGAVRSVVSLAGIENISSKVLGTKNQASNVYATMEALRLMTARYNKYNRIKSKK